MIINLTETTTDQIVSALLAEGAYSGSRVLTLVIDTDRDGLEAALVAAHGASRDHPCRVVAVVAPAPDGVHAADEDRRHHGGRPDGAGHLDAQIRLGHDAGAGETLVLLPEGEAARHADTLVVPFLLPDVPVVAWWPDAPPARPATSPLGALATARITNTPSQPDPSAALAALAPEYTRGDIDLAWTRITLWRAMVASTLDSLVRTGTVHGIVVAGEPRNASVSLMIRWLQLRLGVQVEREDAPGIPGIATITVRTDTGELVISRKDHERVMITRPGSARPQVVTMARREPVATMREELRRLAPDLVYEEVLATFVADAEPVAAPPTHTVAKLGDHQ
ncbi:glucose-6-phosphate dehydrogenase assembly protein OpcA [Actinomyces ruminicola]|uniref:Glucose-6-phosphate dehydrogenase assembly protein OpcA n=1 Tax=Actinomyces ruminicola TaxID=332524 RepID=A0A1G9UL59_9ACTO|nr:glucose-6-phosphate dehydrogenase assembly protein OpcA [Actinomyces ruminicola]SDM60583.1 glucose-6-phosphate dehydrogenase assembly protein OpcA [Actinomyces ruminicola]